MLDALMWWTGAAVWVVAGGGAIAWGLAELAILTCAHVGRRAQIIRAFVMFARSRQ
jgi:L-asparaginase II